MLHPAQNRPPVKLGIEGLGLAPVIADRAGKPQGKAAEKRGVTEMSPAPWNVLNSSGGFYSA